MAMIHLSVFIKPVKTILTSSASQQHAIARLRHLSTQYLFLYDDISHTLALALRVQRRLCYTWCILYLGTQTRPLNPVRAPTKKADTNDVARSITGHGYRHQALGMTSA
jgi:hypothetical protein